MVGILDIGVVRLGSLQGRGLEGSCWNCGG